MADHGKVVKTNLKQARECIRNKEFVEALKHCKAVLKQDKDNYNAYVFIGLCASELEQFDQSKAAYKKAILLAPDQALAWQGLASLIESKKLENVKDLIEAYDKLLEIYLETDKVKWKETCLKLIEKYTVLKKNKKILSYMKLYVKVQHNDSDVVEMQQRMLNVLSQELSSDYNQILVEETITLFEVLLCHSSITPDKVVELRVDYIKSMLSFQKLSDTEINYMTPIEVNCKILLEAESENVFALETLCSMYLQNTKDYLNENTSIYFDKLSSVTDENPMSLVSKAWQMYAEKSFEKSRTILSEVSPHMKDIPSWSSSYYLLYARINFVLHDINQTDILVRKGLSALPSCLFSGCRSYFDLELRYLKAKCSIVKRDTHVEKSKELINSHPESIRFRILLAEAYVASNMFKEALEVCDNLKSLHSNDVEYLLVQVSVHIGLRDFVLAEECAHEAVKNGKENAESHFMLGKVLWLKNDGSDVGKREAYPLFIQTLKLDPRHFQSIYYLGCFSRDIQQNHEKAKKCFLKAYNLNPNNENNAIALADILSHLDEKDAELNLYKNITSNSSAKKCGWAWVRLGLCQMQNNLIDESVKSFQGALTAEKDNKHLWECLADAYVKRGSYTAAMLSYKKALEIDESSIYSSYRIANIKLLLGMRAEAIKDFNTLLSSHPDYIPALNGLCDAHAVLTKHYFAENFNGRAADHCSKSLEFGARALSIKSGLRCTWKSIADVCETFCNGHNCELSFTIPEFLMKATEMEIKGNYTIYDLLYLSSRCYGILVKFDEKNAMAWHDFGLSLYHIGQMSSKPTKIEMLNQSTEVLKTSLGLDSSKAKTWNSLGVVQALSETGNPQLAQHCFIKSLIIDDKSAQVWTNLGALYLKHNNIEMAHEAFKKAQSADPSYVECWIGQASIAEVIGDVDYIDLFRHSTELGSKNEGNIGYTNAVCSELITVESLACQPQPDLSHLPKNCHHAVLNSYVAIRKYCDRNPKDACALNMLGLLAEHSKLLQNAKKAYSSAMATFQTSNIPPTNPIHRSIIINLARVQSALGSYDDALDLYQKCQPLDTVTDVCGLALTLFRAGSFVESYQGYEKALSIAETDQDRSSIQASMGMAAYASGDIDVAKQRFFASSTEYSAPEARGIMALSSIGILTGDSSLTLAALAEIKKLPQKVRTSIAVEICLLQYASFLLQGKPRQARYAIANAVRCYPQHGELWERLSQHLLLLEKKSTIASKCSAISITKRQSKLSSFLLALSSTVSGSGYHKDSKTSRYDAQRLVHSHPYLAESWCLLSASMFTVAATRNEAERWRIVEGTASMATHRVVTTKSSSIQTPGKELRDRSRSLLRWIRSHLIYTQLSNNQLNIKLITSDCEEMVNNSMNDNELNEAKFIMNVSKVWSIIRSSDRNYKSIENHTFNDLIEISVAKGDIQKLLLVAALLIKVGRHVDALPLFNTIAESSANDGLIDSAILSLLRLAKASLDIVSNEMNTDVLAMAHEALKKVLHLKPSNEIALLLLGIVQHYNGDSKSSNRTLKKLESKDSINKITITLCSRWLNINPT